MIDFAVGSKPIILLSEVVLSVLIVVLLKPVNKTLSLVAVVSRPAMTTIHGLNLLNYYFVLQLLNGADFAAVFGPQQVQALVTLFSYGFSIGVAFPVPHVLILGYLFLRLWLLVKGVNLEGWKHRALALEPA